mmetsp:Transcript_15254/g.42200  ORF Transcript_15254/g.42200 Transcript_15254/m.42200 type:complete len:87 (+) Transcript_15254:1948-2208(+)
MGLTPLLTGWLCGQTSPKGQPRDRECDAVEQSFVLYRRGEYKISSEEWALVHCAPRGHSLRMKESRPPRLSVAAEHTVTCWHISLS